MYKKHYPPALNDEVWRLEKIGKDGSFHKRLTLASIYTVEDFLRLAMRDSQKLRNVNDLFSVFILSHYVRLLLHFHYMFPNSFSEAVDSWKWHVK